MHHLKWLHILSMILNMAQSGGYWQGAVDGKFKGIFTMKWTSHITRNCRANLKWVKYSRIKGLPFKIAFFFKGFGGKELLLLQSLKNEDANSLQILFLCKRTNGDNDTFISNSPHNPKSIEEVYLICKVWYWGVASTYDYKMVETKIKYQDLIHFSGDLRYYYVGSIEEEKHKKA